MLSLLYGFGDKRHCSLCGFTGFRFRGYGDPPKRRADVRCPRCKSTERHRLVHRLLADELVGPYRTLHVAPERCISPWLRSISSDYLSIDLYREAMQAMDLTALDLPDACKDLVWCSHVLEHVDDDRKAMAEILRVLVPGGLAVIQVPIRGEHTHEDPTITTDEARTEAFLQWDHVRLYGTDVEERLREAGFDVERRTVDDLPPELVDREVLRYQYTNEVFLCRRPPGD